MNIKQLLKVILLSMLTVACSNTLKQPSYYSKGTSQTGIASYYADKYQFRQTASGELFDQSLKTAAHRTLSFGSIVKVTNLENGRSVMVKINDRGPFIRGRIIDLSKSAFSTIGNTHQGIIKVIIEVIN